LDLLRQSGPLAALILVVAVAATAGFATSLASAANACTFASTAQPFRAWSDANDYFLAPAGDFEGAVDGWDLRGGAAVTSGSESFAVAGAGSNSMALPTTSAVVTTPVMCVTTDTPAFRFFIKNNGNSGHIDGQLAVYLNFSGADGKAQQVKIAAVKVGSTDWTLSPKISFVQYLSTPLKTGSANISFTIKPNDNHGNWQIDDLYVDPFLTK
jgi:hypothetical protein